MPSVDLRHGVEVRRAVLREPKCQLFRRQEPPVRQDEVAAGERLLEGAPVHAAALGLRLQERVDRVAHPLHLVQHPVVGKVVLRVRVGYDVQLIQHLTTPTYL